MGYTRNQVQERISRTVKSGQSVVAAGAGIGISAKFAEKGGADMVIIYNSGRYRMTGHSSWAGFLPIGDANAIVLEMGEREVLPVIKEVPVIAGVFASDPTRRMEYFLTQVKDMGFSGIINFPSVGLLEGAFRDNLEETGLGFQKEVDTMKMAHEMDLYTMAYIFDEDQARLMAEAGVDCIVAHMGNTQGGSVGQTSGVPPLEDAVARSIKIREAALSANPTVVVLCHGGPIAFPADAQKVIQEAHLHGFVGASSMERLPVEKPLTEATRQFKEIMTRI
ncbi:MAG: phosphoenolpyruvate hydrolase family protein [Bacillota bacterium]|nr:phosphoenolpyruvate hydrolase family protein [Bacillota bacterium]MDW7678434.1 phosphoenolpyruvate hydrolase family protein [Bacillota bacterium]